MFESLSFKRVSQATVAAAVVLWGALALALNTDVLPNWAYDSRLPEAAKLRAISAAEAIDGAAQAIGLGAVKSAARGLMGHQDDF